MTRETSVVAEALLRSLFDRADTLRLYLGELQAQNVDAESGLGRALDMFVVYTKAIADQAVGDWEEFANPHGRVRNMRALLEHLLEQERTVDRRLARAGQTRVPRSLASMIRDECQSLGIDDVEPIVTIGPPATFEVLPDLHKILFGSLYRSDQPQYERPTLALITLPYLEGTRAAWRPLVVGHELGHLKVLTDEFDIFSNRVRIGEWISDQVMDDIGDLPRSFFRLTGFHPDFGKKACLVGTVKNWATEVLCDLNAVRLYGSAAVAAHGEFLEVIGATVATSGSHPPGSVRARIMLQSLGGALQERTNRAVLAPWSALVESEPELEPWVQALSKLLEERRVELSDEIGRWGTRYDGSARGEAIRWLARRLTEGIPGSTGWPGESDEMVSDRDMVNATWLARQLEEWREVDEQAPDMSTLSLQEQELPIDRLASKAIDTLAFLKTWTDQGGADAITPLEMSQMAGGESQAAQPGLLSGIELRRRIDLKSSEPEALVVTPLMADSIREAGIDVRLSSTFITFKHSATASFDALSEFQAPRAMQSLVEKAWGDTFILHPRELVLAATLEYLVIPGDLAGQVVTRSSYGRLGLITATAVQVQPYSKGCLTLELVNLGEMPLTLTPGERIAQLVFHRIGSRTTRHGQKYLYPTGPEFSKVKQDPEVEVLRRLRHR